MPRSRRGFTYGNQIMRSSYLLSFIALALGLPVAGASAARTLQRSNEAVPETQNEQGAAIGAVGEVKSGLPEGRPPQAARAL